MSVSIHQSLIEQFSFEGKSVRTVHVKGTGECLVASDVWRAIGYDRKAGVQAIQRLVPEKYKMRLGDACVDLEGVLRSEYTQPNTVLLKEPGLYCFLLRCGKPEAEPFMEWACEEVLPREVRKLAGEIDAERHKVQEKDMQLALLNDDLTESENLVRELEFNNTGLQGEIRAKDQELAVLRQRHVPLLKNEEKNYGITIIAKNDESAEYPFISICGQHGYRKQKKRVVLLKNIRSTEFADRDTPNAIVTYNVWREHGLIETDPRKPRDFRLVNIAEEQLLQLQE